MSEIDLATAIEHRDAWLAADLKLATAQSYTFAVGGNAQTVTRADAEFVKYVNEMGTSELHRTSISTGKTRLTALAPAVPGAAA